MINFYVVVFKKCCLLRTIMEALYKGNKRKRLKKRTNRVIVSDTELFTRLLYYGLTHLYLSQDEVWLMPFGLFLDL